MTYSKEVKSELSVIDDLCVGNSPILFVIKIIFEQFIEAESCQELLVLFSPHSLHHESRDTYLRLAFRTFLTAAVRHFFFAPRDSCVRLVFRAFVNTVLCGQCNISRS